jgi:hypothetical protein
VRDENDRPAVFLESPEDDVEVVDLLWGKESSRFVEDEDATALIEGAEDFDALLQADREVRDAGVGVDIESV